MIQLLIDKDKNKNLFLSFFFNLQEMPDGIIRIYIP